MCLGVLGFVVVFLVTLFQPQYRIPTTELINLGAAVETTGPASVLPSECAVAQMLSQAQSQKKPEP